MTELELFPANVTVQLPETASLDGELDHVELTDDGVIELHAAHVMGEPQCLARISHPDGGRFSGVEIRQVADHYKVGDPRWPLSEKQREGARNGDDPYSRRYWDPTPQWIRYWRSLSTEQKDATQADIDERRALVDRIYGDERNRNSSFFSGLIASYRELRGLPRADWLMPAEKLPSLEEQAQSVRRGLSPTEERIMLDVAMGGGIEQPDTDDQWSLERFEDDASMVRQLALRELVAPPANPNSVELTELGKLVGEMLIAEHEAWQRQRAKQA
jgi:hypothetical protein